MEREMLFALSERKHYYCIILLSSLKLIAFFSFPMPVYNLHEAIRRQRTYLLDILLHAVISTDSMRSLSICSSSTLVISKYFFL